MLKFFRWIGFMEAASFILLLMIAMPLKYIWGMPQGVAVLGALHGGLFIIYGIFALLMARMLNWPISQLVLAWVASVVPLGTLFFDKKFLR